MHLDPIKQQVERIKGVVPSVVAMSKAYADLLEAHKGEPEEIQAIVDEMRTQADALAAAVASNP